MKPTRIAFPFVMLLLCAAFLSACDDVSRYTSTDAGQEFTNFSPEVETVTAPINDITITSSGGGSSTSGTATSTGTSTSSSGSGSISAPSLATTGVVWKPVSEGDHKLVVLTPTSYGSPSITILDANGNGVENGRYIGHTNGNRATYRFSRAGGGYSAPAYLKINSSVYLVSSPASRYN